MTVKANKIQVGQNADPLKNFTIMVPDAPDGSMEIRRGNADAPGVLLTKVNADGGVNTKGPVFRAYQGAAQTIPHYVYTKLVFPSEDIDTSGRFDTVNSRFTPNVAGYYSIHGSMSQTGSGNSFGTQVVIYKNGEAAQSGPITPSVPSQPAFCAVLGLIYLNGTTDYVELFGWQAIGADNTTRFGLPLTNFSGFLAMAA